MGATDLYIEVTAFNQDTLKTDTHFRAQNKKGKFNWRMIFDYKYDQYSV